MSRFWTYSFSLAWIVFMFFGFYQVYLFLNGYPLLTFGNKEEQKGYVSFSSFPSSSFFMDDEYIGKGDIHILYKIGVYTVCAEKLGYSPRCFENSQVKTNDQEMLHYRNIILLPNPIDIRTITAEKTYTMPSSDGFFWYDANKKQIFWIDSTTPQLQSFFPSFVPDAIEFDEQDNVFYLLKNKTKTEPERKERLLLGSFSFSLPQKPSFYSALSFDDYTLWHHLVPKTIGGEQKKIKVASFDTPIETAFPLESDENIILVFANRVVLFSVDAKDIRPLFSKDPKSPVLYFKEANQLWFVSNHQLQMMQW